MIVKKQIGRIMSVVLALTVLIGSLGLLTNAEITTSTTSQVTVLTPPDSIDVSSLGTNIVTDPTVAEWDGDTYKTYYSTIGSSVSASVVGNANAWWDQPACFNQRYAWGGGKTFGTLKENNRLTKDVTHTADGSGSIVIKSKSSYLPIQTNATPKYFLYTFYAKAAADNTTIMFRCIKSDGAEVGTQVNTKIHSDWTLVTLLLTAGTATIHGMNVYVDSASATAPVYIDDVYMFQLDDTYGETLKEKGKFLSPDDITYASSDTASAKLVTIADDFDFSSLGTNLAYDANVSKFTDGVYDTATGIRGVGGVTNTNQDMWGSPTVYNGYSSATADSHTQDGSGALKYTLSGANHRLFRVAPNSESHSYYLVTFYYKGPQLLLRHYFNHNQIPSGNASITTVTGATDWQRVSYIVYSGSYANAMNMGGYIQSGTAYFDDFAVYKLSSGLGGKSTAAGKLLSADDIKYASSDTAVAKTVTISSTYNFASLGTNLAYDSNVSKFTDGVYDTATGIRGVGGVTNTNQDMWGSPTVYNGYSSATADSHTQDGSGALKYTLSGANHRLFRVAPNSESHSYYLVTFYYKGPQLLLRHYFNHNQIPSGNASITTVTGATDWQRVSYIVYSGSYANAMNMGGYIQSGTAYFDDFAVYKLSSGLGGRSYEAGELLSATNQTPMPNDSKVFTVNDSDTKYVDFTQFGATIVTDPTVKEFNADGTYKTYYENETTGDGVLNSNAWWGKAVNKYQAFTKNVSVYKSPKARGLLSNDTALSHTADGSGVIKFPASSEQQEIYLPLPKMEAKTGYVITAWVNFTADSSVNLQIFNNNLQSQIEKQVSFAQGWQRVIFFYYPGENAASGYSMRIHSSTTGAVIDDINVQPLDDDYTRECINTSKLPENKERPAFPTEPKYLNATFDSNGWPYLYDDNNNVDWDSFGENLITDPTVKEFNADGTYKAYYADETTGTGVVSGTKAWWGKAANNWQAFHTNANGLLNYGGAKPNNALTNETKYSHTDDGSGAIIMKKNQFNYRLPLPKFESNSTYVVTFWVKFIESKGHNIRLYVNSSSSIDKVIESNYNTFDSLNWKRVTFLVYTNDKTHSEAFIEIYNNTVGFVDDVAVYKLTDDEYAVQCLNAGKVVADGVDPTEAPAKDTDPPAFPEFQPLYVNATKGTEVYDYSDFDFSTLGTNLIPDPTVKEFNADGTYKAYYADESTGTGTANANAWWGKAINKYQMFSTGATKPNMWFSPKSRNILSNDTTLSHTNDGSGVIYWEGGKSNFCIPLSKMEMQSYYVVTFWVKFNAADVEMRFQSSTGQNLNIRYSVFGAKNTWQRVTMLIFTGASTFSEPNISFYCEQKSYIDDVAVYKLDNAYGAQCVAAGKIVYKDSYAVETPNVDGYNFETSNNLMTDGSFEDNGTTNSSAKFGSKVFKITAQNSKITLPRLSFSKYYLISYYVRTKGFASSDKAVATIKNDAGELYTISTAATNNGWKQVTALVNTGDHRDITIDFSTAGLTSSKEIYVDGVAIHELPAKVAEAASIIDKYKMGVLNADIAGTAKDVFGDAGQSGEYKIWKKLVSPIKSTDTEKVTYASLFTKYYNDYERQDKISRGFAPTGFGFRREFSNLTSDPIHNLITNTACDDATYWADSTGFVTVTTEEKYEGNTSLKVDGEGLYLKKLTVKPNTVYYLSLRGMAYSDAIVPHTHFGIGVIENNTFLPFENPKSAYETSEWTRDGSSKQEITIKYPDGTWYNRTYQFNTGDNKEIYFFIKGVKGVTYLDNIEIFEAANSKPRNTSKTVGPLDTTNDEETRFVCDEKYNLIPNGMFDKGTEFWGNFNGLNKFVEVATSEGNKMLHYKGSKWGYYYLPTVKLEANKTYTFSFWFRTLNGVKGKFGIVSLNNPRAYISAPCDLTINRGEWTLFSITFNTFEESEVAFAIYNSDGEAAFDKIRLFESQHGYELSLTEDMPKGGLTFSDSALGTDGLIELEDEELDEDTDDTLFEDDEFFEDEDGEEEEEGEETEETTKKVIHKYKKKPSTVKLATWFIVLMIVVAVLVLAGITFLIIFLVKRKKKKQTVK